MNNETKHIEQLPAEEPIAQAMAAATSEDLLTESLQPLLEEAEEGYTPVAVQPYTSPVAELPAAIKTLIRTVVRRPLAMLADRGTSRRTSLLDALLNTWNALRARLAGDAEWSIPDRRNEMTGLSLSSAFGLLKDRDMSSGIMLTTAADGHSAPVGDDTDITRPLPDGLSLAQLLCSTPADRVTEIVDSNTGYSFNRNTIFSLFTNVHKWKLWCKDFTHNPSYGYNYGQGFLRNIANVRVLDLPIFEGFHGPSSDHSGIALYCYYAVNCADLEEVHLPAMFIFTGENSPTNGNNISNDPKLWWVEMGDIKITSASYYFFYNCPNLVRLQFKGVQVGMNLANWSPTNALNAELSDLVEDPEAHPDWNNLSQFLSNFRDYIADRLADRTGLSSLTLTLSQEVRDAIHAAETTYHIEDIIVNQKHWTLSPAPSAEQ